MTIAYRCSWNDNKRSGFIAACPRPLLSSVMVLGASPDQTGRFGAAGGDERDPWQMGAGGGPGAHVALVFCGRTQAARKLARPERAAFHLRNVPRASPGPPHSSKPRLERTRRDSQSRRCLRSRGRITDLFHRVTSCAFFLQSQRQCGCVRHCWPLAGTVLLFF